MHFVFDAIDHAGLFDEYGIGQMRRWKIESDTQSFREMWGSGDYSHGWQCTPLYQMSSKILGGHSWFTWIRHHSHQAGSLRSHLGRGRCSNPARGREGELEAIFEGVHHDG